VHPAAGQATGAQHQFVATQQTSDGKLHVTLAITPDRFGPNIFTVTLPDQQATRVLNASLSTTMLDMDMGTDTMELSSDGHGHWSGTGSLSMTGDWQVRVLIHTSDGEIHTATFTLTKQ
jgi:hypothetical protein